MGALAALTASTASASETPAGTVQVCKASVTGTLAVTGSFTFSISGGGGTVTVPTGDCSNPIPVSSSTVTISETVDPSYSVAAITPEAGGTYVVAKSTNLLQHAVSGIPAQSVQVTTTPSTTSTVTFTNQIDPGYVEVCKYATPGSGLSGTYSFNVKGAEGWLNGGPASAANPPIALTIPVNGSACSNPIEMPASSLLVNGSPVGVAGDTVTPVTVTEAGSNLYVTSISANITNDSDAALESDNLVNGTANLAVEPASTTNNDTIVNYTDDVVSFKVCKAWDSSNGSEAADLLGGANTAFPFTYTVSGVAGPDAALAANSVTAGNCTADSTYRAGTEITVNEGVTAGSKVESIALQNPLSGTLLSAPAGGVIESQASNAQLTPSGTTPSAVAGTVSVLLGTPVTAATTSPSNETVVDVTDVGADPGSLKICKVAGTPAPVATASGQFTFNWSGFAYATVASAPGVTPVVTVGEPIAVSGTTSVTPGNCSVVTEAPVNSSTGVGTTVPFLYNSNVSVTEVATTGNAVSAISVNNPFVVETLGGTPTTTTESALSGVNLGTGVSTVTVSESGEAILNYTNVDPPAATSPSASTPGASTPATSSTPAVTSGGSVVTAGTTAKVTSAKVKKLEKQLASVKAQIKVLSKKLSSKHLSKAVRKADAKKLAALRTLERKLVKELK